MQTNNLGEFFSTKPFFNAQIFKTVNNMVFTSTEKQKNGWFVFQANFVKYMRLN